MSGHGTGFGAKIADPASLAAGTGNCVRFDNTGDYVFLAHNTSPFISA